MLEKMKELCHTRFSGNFSFHGQFSLYELVLLMFDKLNEVIEYVNGFKSLIDQKEDSINITNNRKLSQSGDFTGTWFGDSKANVDQKILDGQLAYQEIKDLILSNPQLNVEIYDEMFFTTEGVPDVVLDGGEFGDPYTQEIDGGYFKEQCKCI